MIDIKKYLKGKKIVIGTNTTLKNLRNGKLEAVLLSANCPEKIKKELTHYCNLSNCKVEQLSIQNDELGILCKKQFSVSVVGLMK